MVEKTKFGLVGCGHRGVQCFVEELVALGIPERMVALCDPNKVRLKVAAEHLGREARLYGDYVELLNDDEANWIIVSTPDHTHHKLVMQAFEAGKNVLVEKPMATSVEACDEMIEKAEEKSLGFRCVFNLRFNLAMRAVKELLDQGLIGEMISLEAFDILRVGHGSDYLRRWHRQRNQSGGLLIHKGCHVFDILNWWVNAEPAEVFAQGSKSFFKPRPGHGKNCRNCAIADECELYVDIEAGVPTGVSWETLIKDLYLDAEKEDGYLRDRCVFDEEIDIWDNTSVVVKYDNGVTATYTEVLFSPFAKRRYVLNGTKGRLEVNLDDRGIVFYPLFRGDVKEVRRQIMDLDAPSTNPPEVIDPQQVMGDRLRARGGHGGADGNLMLSLLEDAEPSPSQAGPIEGRRAVLIGDAGNRSIDRGQVVRIAEEFGPVP